MGASRNPHPLGGEDVNQRYVNLGQEDKVKDLPQYKVWLDWKKPQSKQSE
ncbi:TPA: hypothetical protein SID15_002078 [Pasteurella multocida]|nr:hypothetical protein [Pasteurella multocida]HEH9668995.1 hypothetical protein [Pasteurella multocida]HEH9696349.1 hypothetical protein [Pasteurella multocida]HEH9784324.1 hypothetical protein [Pasteurella multocida]HEH9797688.1 hypothetical protein [Pasteurella multocida]